MIPTYKVKIKEDTPEAAVQEILLADSYRELVKMYMRRNGGKVSGRVSYGDVAEDHFHATLLTEAENYAKRETMKSTDFTIRYIGRT